MPGPCKPRQGFSRLTSGQSAWHIYDNKHYNIWVGDFNREDVEATGNWWGGHDPVETIFDARREPGIGLVNYEPILEAPVSITISDPGQ